MRAAMLAGIVDDGPSGGVQSFETGATRSAATGRPDLEGYISPLVIERFGEYMLKHQVQADGNVRESDNWQKGMPIPTYMKGLTRHVHHLQLRHRGNTPRDPLSADGIEEDLCAVMFNAMGLLYEILVAKGARRGTDPVSAAEWERGPSPHVFAEDEGFRHV